MIAVIRQPRPLMDIQRFSLTIPRS